MFLEIATTLGALAGAYLATRQAVNPQPDAMGIPFKVSTTTSNFMIGVTAAASAGIYLTRGYIDPGLAMPVMLGVLLGSCAGARFLARAKSATLRLVFSAVVVLPAIQVIYNGAKGL